jgi:hypothetical protein
MIGSGGESAVVGDPGRRDDGWREQATHRNVVSAERGAETGLKKGEA